MAVTGLSSARRFTTTLVANVTERRAERAVTVALIIGQGGAAALTPIDTSFLINSQFRRITRKPGGGYSGMVGYTARYAAAVHGMSGKLKGQPREHFGVTREGVQFGGGTGVGNYWDPDAEPMFLTKGFERNLRAIDEQVRRAFRV